MTCSECKQSMLPNDPSKPVYVGFNSKFKGVSSLSGCLPPLCNDCHNQEKEKESNIKKEKEKSTLILNKEQTGQLQQIHSEVFYLRNKLTEHLTKSSKKTYVIK